MDQYVWVLLVTRTYWKVDGPNDREGLYVYFEIVFVIYFRQGANETKHYSYRNLFEEGYLTP